jgi:thioredoxin-like negative regulator of GroEL
MMVFRLGTAALTALVCAASARAGDVQDPFRNLSFDQALVLAETQKRIIFVDFYTTWCGPCQQMDATTWKDPKVMDPLERKTIALKIDAEKELALAKRYHVQAYPSLVLIKPDGTLLEVLVGYHDATRFLTAFESAQAGSTALQRATQASADAPLGDFEKQVQTRFELARALSARGKSAEALAAYLWIYDESRKQPHGLQSSPAGMALMKVQALAGEFPPAKEALEARRQDLLKAFLAAPGQVEHAVDLTAFNGLLREPEATLAVFDGLAPDSPGRGPLGRMVRQTLVDRQRYEDAAAFFPQSEVQALVERIPAGAVEGGDMGAHSRFSAAGVAVEALAGSGRGEEARSLVHKLLALDASLKARALLRKRLQRSGHPFPLEGEEPEPAGKAPIR